MASISASKNGRRTIQFVGSDGKRRSIRLGKCSKRHAESVKVKVESLVASKLTGHALDDETARWVRDLDQKLAVKLATTGLIPDSYRPRPLLGRFLDDNVARRTDVKPATKEIWQHVVRNLVGHFGNEKLLTEVTEWDAEEFRMYLRREGLAPTTVYKRLQFARMFFRAAVRQKAIVSNPFADVTAKADTSGRKAFIPPDDTARLIACADPTWQTIIALCRYGGLRCPSEVLSLRWIDVNWETCRITVHSPKTEHHPGKESREIPLFAELRPFLEEALERAPERAVYVIDPSYRRSALTDHGWRNCNLRTQFGRIIARAGLKPWPRLFHSLRASRETELMEEYPIHVVAKWLGNTPKIALKHYLAPTDADFQKAAGTRGEGAAKSGARDAEMALQKAVQQPAASSREVPQETTQVPAAAGTCAESRDVSREYARKASGEDRSAHVRFTRYYTTFYLMDT